METNTPRTREDQLVYVVNRMFKYLERFTSPTGDIRQYFGLVPGLLTSLITAFALEIDSNIGCHLDDPAWPLSKLVKEVMRMFKDEILQLPSNLQAELDEFTERVVKDGKIRVYLTTLHRILSP